ncbi:hypothetical protein HDE_00833 [Halotydeus destructor]|nr:hypothetical protein HDE_00833 [Halotydeus destructor]
MAAWQLVALAVLASVTISMATTEADVKTAATAAASTAPAARQNAIGVSGIMSALGSLMPSAFGNMLPLVVLFGLGALMVPALGLGLLLREGRRSDHPYYYRSFPSFNINTSAIMDGMSDVFERVMKALDNVEKKYN